MNDGHDMHDMTPGKFVLLYSEEHAKFFHKPLNTAQTNDGKIVGYTCMHNKAGGGPWEKSYMWKDAVVVGYMNGYDQVVSCGGVLQGKFKDSEIKEKNAIMCSICNSAANLHTCGMFVCQSNVNHVADTYTGLFTDLTPPSGEAKRKAQAALIKMHKTPIHDNFPMFYTGDMHMGHIDHIGPKIKEALDNVVIVGKDENAGKVLLTKSGFVKYKAGGLKKKMTKEQIHKLANGFDNFLKALCPQVFAPALENPRSAWGKKMKEKLLKQKG